jgi:GTP diphosphokinase / guanosine-3',5'-bis(diphosphate) 3'-diphosphatase
VATCAHVISGDPDGREILAIAGLRTFTLRATASRYFRDDTGLDVALLHLADDSEPSHDHVLASDEIKVGDHLWTFGFGDKVYGGGKPASFDFEGLSRRLPGSALVLGRVHGTPVGPGYSGSPVANRRTGAVWGMLCTSDHNGSAHMLPIALIRELDEAVQLIHSEPEARQRQWLAMLDDDQLLAGGWRFPSSVVRAYLKLAPKTADLHPYSAIVTGVAPRPLSEVYVQSFAWENAGSDVPAREGERLRAGEVFDSPGNSVLIGGAGAGKSSLLCAAVGTMVRRWEDREPTEPSRVPLPVLVRAVDLVDDRPFPEALALSISGDPILGKVRSWPAEMFERPPLPASHWLVLVDGLDELMSAEHRRDVLAKLARIHDESPGLFRFVVATRPLPEDETAVPPTWVPRCFQLLPFDDGQLRELAGRWFVQGELQDPSDAVNRFTARVQGSELTEVSRNPLMATILCRLFVADPNALLPLGRSQIFEAFERHLYDRQYGERPAGIRYQIDAALDRFGHDARSVGELLALVPDVIGRLAWHRMSGNTSPTMDLVSDWLSGLRPSNVPDLDWHGLLRELLRRSGVIQERADDFVFIHQTIAEHRAAKYVIADAARSDAAFRELFQQASWRDTESSSRWQQSYARFLVAGWSERPDLPKALRRVLDNDGHGGAQFVASLKLDGLELPGDLHEKSLRRLSDFAVDPALSEQDRRGSALTVLASDQTSGRLLLARAIRTPTLTALYRSWALETLANARQSMPSGASARSSPQGSLRRAMQSLAEVDSAGRELIAYVAADPTWLSAEREWAAQALQTVGDPRGKPAPRPASARPLPTTSHPARLKTRSIFAGRPRLGARRAAGTDPVLESLIKTLRAHHPKADVRTVERAYEVAAYWHRGQERKSGEPYIRHPLAAATIVAEIGMDSEAICAELLHDIIEDTPYTLADLRAEFGEEIAALVDGVTKLDKVKFGDAAEPETVRKMVVAMARDIRVLILELACRLHDMQTVRHLRRESQERLSREALEIFAPLADRIGMNTVKWELEDLAFATLYPRRYDEIARLVSQPSPRRDQLLQEVITDLSADLHEARIKGTVNGRPKHYYSIYQQMIARNVEFDEIYDLVGIRVLVDSVRDCYSALGTIHARWNPVPGRFNDHIAMPRRNLYQSLDTTVIGPGGKPVELEIHTLTMLKRAEYGVAVRWKFQNEMNAAPKDGREEAAEMAWLRQIVDWQRETEDPAEFLDALRFDLAGAEVYVFTPRGEVLALPQDATPVDFAYAIHTDVGHRTIGARVNGRLVALECPLETGDTVEIFTSKSQEAGPNRDWLTFVKSARARNKIRQWFAKEPREAAAEAGRDQIAKVMREHGRPLQRLISADVLREVADEFRYPDPTALYAAVGEGRIGAQSVVTKLASIVGGGAQEALAETPADRVVDDEAAPNGDSASSIVMQVEALNRTDLLADVTRALAEQHVEILFASVTAARDRVVVSRFTFETADPAHLDNVMRTVRSVDGVYDVHRVTHVPTPP